jgi:hypothetical protein
MFTREWTGQRLYSRCEHLPRGPPASQQRTAIPIVLYARFCVSWSLQQMSKLQCACQGPQHIGDHLPSFELPRCSAYTCMKEAVCLRWAVDELCPAGEQIQRGLSIVEVQCPLSMSTPHQYPIHQKVGIVWLLLQRLVYEWHSQLWFRVITLRFCKLVPAVECHGDVGIESEGARLPRKISLLKCERVYLGSECALCCDSGDV